MNFVDNGYISAIQNTPRPNYFAPYAQMFGLMEQSPWSYRNQQQTNALRYQMMMQQERMNAEIAARNALANYRNQMLQWRLSRGANTGSGGKLGSYIDRINAFRNQQAVAVPQPSSMPGGLPPVDTGLPTDNGAPTQSDAGLIPVNPSMISPDAPPM